MGRTTKLTMGHQAPTDLTGYEPPLPDILLALQVAGLDDVLSLPPYAGTDRDSVEMALSEFGRFASEVIAPTDHVGDIEGAELESESGTVKTPDAFRDVYRQYVETGWGGVQFPGDWGGGGLPLLVGFAVQEMMATANLSLSLGPVLTQGAIELLLEWGSVSQRSRSPPETGHRPVDRHDESHRSRSGI